MKNTLYRDPPAVQPGDRIALAAPAGPFVESDIAAGLGWLRQHFEVVYTPRHRKRGYLAGSDSERLMELQDVLNRPDISMIMCVRGGYGTMRILRGIDYDGFKESPKTIVGCSDITAFLCDISVKTGIGSVHGPMLEQLGKADERTRESLLSCLKGHPQSFKKLNTVVSGQAEGSLMGGNLTMLSHLAGTQSMPDLEGAILFIEDVGERPYRIDRALEHLSMAGELDKVSGIVLGDFYECGDENSLITLGEIFYEKFRHLDVPVASGLQVGHKKVNFSLPFTRYCRLAADEERGAGLIFTG